MTAPVTGITPVYGLEYLIEGEPARYTRQKLERNAKAIEAALVAGGIAPPGASDLATLSGRVTVLETAAPRLEVYRSTGSSFGGTFAMPYDSIRTAQTTPVLSSNTNAWYTFDPTGRRILIKQAGLYHFEAAVATTVAEDTQLLRLVKMPTAGTAGPTIAVHSVRQGYGRLIAEERIAAGEYVGVFLTSTGSDVADNAAGGSRNLFTVRRISA
jgi:hypothetical protein